jgi:hypothetical protein
MRTGREEVGKSADAALPRRALEHCKSFARNRFRHSVLQRVVTKRVGSSVLFLNSCRLLDLGFFAGNRSCGFSQAGSLAELLSFARLPAFEFRLALFVEGADSFGVVLALVDALTEFLDPFEGFGR